jgi:hypothetical protein
MGRPPVGDPDRNDRLDALAGQPCTQRIVVIAPIGNQARGTFARPSGCAWPPDGDGVEGLFEEGHFHRGRRLQVCSQRSTRAIDQNHPLRAPAPLGLADFGPPFSRG